MRPPGWKRGSTENSLKPPERRAPHALRTEDLPLRARPPARSFEAVRHDYNKNLAAPRYRAGRLLDRRNRRYQPDPLLLPQMGIARGPRKEMGGLPGRSRVDKRTGGDRKERRDRRPRRKPDPATDQLFVG